MREGREETEAREPMEPMQARRKANREAGVWVGLYASPFGSEQPWELADPRGHSFPRLYSRIETAPSFGFPVAAFLRAMMYHTVLFFSLFYLGLASSATRDGHRRG